MDLDNADPDWSPKEDGKKRQRWKEDEVDWSPREDGKKRQRWKENEVLALLRLVRRHVLLDKTISNSELGEALVKPMANIGYNRTSFQLKLKIQSLRRSYIQCKKNGCTPTAKKECPYYDILVDIYSELGNAQSDSDSENIHEIQDKVNIWSDKEIRKMFSVIEELDLAHELSNTFSLGALRLISKALRYSSYDRSVEQVNAALTSLKTTYVTCRWAMHEGKESKHCPYYEHLDKIWRTSDILSKDEMSNISGLTFKNYNVRERERGEFWSEEEIIVLLTSIKELDIVEEAFRNTESAAIKLVEALKDSGYMRTKNQIRSKLKNLKRSFISGKRANCLERAIRQFPFYHQYERLFGQYFINLNLTPFLNNDDDENVADESDQMLVEYEESLTNDRKKHNRSPAWSEEETILLLSLIREINLIEDIKDRMSLDVVRKLVIPLEEHGFLRTAVQIKTKLKNLRTSYHRCIQAGLTPQTLAECPFYNRLHAIFQRPLPAKKLETLRKLEPVDHNYVNAVEAATDHSYVNVLDMNESMDTSKSEKISSKVNEVWFPVETIIDNESSVASPDNDDMLEDKEHQDEDEPDFDELQFEEVDERELFVDRNLEASPRAELPDNVDNDSTVSLEKESTQMLELPKDSLEDETSTPVEKVRRIRSGNRIISLEQLKESSRNVDDEQVTLSEPVQSKSLFNREKPISSLKSTFEKTESLHKMSSINFGRSLSRGERLGISNPYPLKKTHEPAHARAMKLVMTDVLKHEKWMQQQHHMWMEKQFEIQRKHDRDQREMLLNELREFRRAITSTIIKREFFRDN